MSAGMSPQKKWSRWVLDVSALGDVEWDWLEPNFCDLFWNTDSYEILCVSYFHSFNISAKVKPVHDECVLLHHTFLESIVLRYWSCSRIVAWTINILLNFTMTSSHIVCGEHDWTSGSTIYHTFIVIIVLHCCSCSENDARFINLS